tara:strand:- start:2245 stop:3153 length:909 start_codon:yes stop_codon:yes gene_type:complete
MIAKYYPMISIVIPSYNQGCYLEETINSILNQKYPNIQLIIIDGESDDNTTDIARNYSESIDYFISEKDSGQANALNKGFLVARGDICAYINSDDIYLDNIFWKISDKYLKEKFKWICSDVLIGASVDDSKVWEPKTISYESFCVEQTIGQQGVFWENNSLKKPWFDENLQYAMDHKFFLSLYKKFGPPHYLKEKGSFFRIHKNSKTSKFQEILFKERKIITLNEANHANSGVQKRKIMLERKRLNLKIQISQKFSIMAKKLEFKSKLYYFLLILLIFLKAPFKFRDGYFLGYLKKSLYLFK